MENNPAKKNFFDFMQGELEFSLEKLVKKHEENWKDYIEPEINMNPGQKGSSSAPNMHLGERFFKYKQDVNTMRDTVERHFSKIINEIEAGLPSVSYEEVKKEDDEDQDFFTKGKTWTCINCTMIN